jgi:hypothetical protein
MYESWIAIKVKVSDFSKLHFKKRLPDCDQFLENEMLNSYCWAENGK